MDLYDIYVQSSCGFLNERCLQWTFSFSYSSYNDFINLWVGWLFISFSDIFPLDRVMRTQKKPFYDLHTTHCVVFIEGETIIREITLLRLK